MLFCYALSLKGLCSGACSLLPTHRGARVPARPGAVAFLRLRHLRHHLRYHSSSNPLCGGPLCPLLCVSSVGGSLREALGPGHRRTVNTDEKTKVVAAVWGGRIYSIPYCASSFAQDELHQDYMEKGLIHPFLKIVLVQNSQHGKELNKFYSPNSSDDLCLLFCISGPVIFFLDQKCKESYDFSIKKIVMAARPFCAHWAH